MLGACGKLGRMVRAVWSTSTRDSVELIGVSRRHGADVVWDPAMPESLLPNADVVVALWGITSGDAVALQGNSVLAMRAVEVAQAVGASRVLHASSAAVYEPGPAPLQESVVTGPVRPYGQAKRDMESALQGPDDAVTSVCLRLGNIAGADSLFANMTPGGTVTLDRFADGTGPARSYLGPGDLARVLNALSLAEEVPGVLNVSAPSPTAMADLAAAASCKVIWRDAPDGAAPMVHLDTTRLASLCPLPEESAEAGFLVRDAIRTEVWP